MTFRIKRNDTTPAYEVTLQYPAGTAVDLTTATEVRFLMADAVGALKVNRVATIVSATQGKVKNVWQSADTDTAGFYRVEWQVTWGDGTKQTFPNEGYLMIEVQSDLGP